MSRWWWTLLLFAAAVVLLLVDVGYGIGLLGLAVLVAGLVAVQGAPADSTLRLRPTVDENGVAWLDRRGEVVESERWEDVERVRAWTRVLWTGNGWARYQHHLDVVTAQGGEPRRTVHPRRSTPSLDDLLAQMRKRGVPVEDDRRFGMWESVRRGV